MSWIGWSLAALAMLAAAGAVRWRAILMRLIGAHIPRRAFAEHRALIAGHLQLRLPEGDGPFPVVLLLHGCGGPRDVMPAYAQTAVEAGIAAAIVNSLTPRGIDYETAVQEVCGGKRLWGRERASDVYAALDLLRRDPKIDNKRIAIGGWSHGGWALLDAMALARTNGRPDGLASCPEHPLDGVQGVFLVYPYAGFPAIAARRAWTSGAPVHAILVKGDEKADTDDAERVLQSAERDGAPVERSWFEGVTHAFDEKTHRADSALQYDEAAARRLHALFADFLRKTLVKDAP
ncbi:MAG: dienelactone hydrolase family protein [Pseudomonadota bacterium]